MDNARDNDRLTLGARLIAQAYNNGMRSLTAFSGGYLGTLSGREQSQYIEQVWEAVQTAVEFGMADALEISPYSEEGRLLIMAGAIVSDGLSGQMVLKSGAERMGNYKIQLREQVEAYRKFFEDKFSEAVEVEGFKRAQQMVDEADRETTGNIGEMYSELVDTLVQRLDRVRNEADNRMESLVEAREEIDQYKKLVERTVVQSSIMARRIKGLEKTIVGLEGELVKSRNPIKLSESRLSDKEISYLDAKVHFLCTPYLVEEGNNANFPSSDIDIYALVDETIDEIAERDETFLDEVSHLSGVYDNQNLEIPEILFSFGSSGHRPGIFDL